MARPLRIEYPGALYHVTSRGDRQEPIFDDDRDRMAFLNVLGDVVSRFRWQCHAYCLMGNHYHLMIEWVFRTIPAGRFAPFRPAVSLDSGHPV
jgi:putative transposase